MKQMRGKPLKPCPWCLFETIEKLMQSTDIIWMSRIHISWRLMHIYFFFQKAMKKCMWHIKVSQFPSTTSNKAQKEGESLKEYLSIIIKCLGYERNSRLRNRFFRGYLIWQRWMKETLGYKIIFYPISLKSTKITTIEVTSCYW